MDITTNDPNAPNETPRVAVLGTGAVGSAVALALLAGAHPVTVWNRTPARLDRPVRAGAEPAGTAADAASAAELLLLCPTDYGAVHELLDAVAGVVAGRTVAVLVTGSPQEADAAADRVAEAGADHLDGGLQTGPDELGGPQALVLWSGAPEVFERHRATLERIGTARHVGGTARAAAVHDLVLFGLWYDGQLAVLRALETVRAAGVDVRGFAAQAAVSLGHVVDAVRDTADELATGVHPRGPADLTEHAPVLDRIAEMRRDLRLGDGDLDRVRAMVRARIDAGHGAEGFTGILG